MGQQMVHYRHSFLYVDPKNKITNKCERKKERRIKITNIVNGPTMNKMFFFFFEKKGKNNLNKIYKYRKIVFAYEQENENSIKNIEKNKQILICTTSCWYMKSINVKLGSHYRLL